MAKRVYKFATEILSAIQKDQGDVTLYLNNTTLKAIFGFTYLPEKKWLLPKGCPPYREAPEPFGMTPTNFLQTVRTWSNWSRADISDAKREALFINVLEGVHPSEAALLIAIKNGTLTKLYPFATKEFGATHGFLPKIEKAKFQKTSEASAKAESAKAESAKAESAQSAKTQATIVSEEVSPPKRKRSPNGVRALRKGSVAERLAKEVAAKESQSPKV